MHLVENTVVDDNNSYLFYTLYVNIGGEKTQDANKRNYKWKVHYVWKAEIEDGDKSKPDSEMQAGTFFSCMSTD